MTWKNQTVLYSPDSTEGGGSEVSAPTETITPAAAETSISSFLDSLSSGEIANDIPTDEAPREVLGDETGKPVLPPSEALPSVHNQRVPKEPKVRPAPVQTTQRDLTGFSPEDAALLKQMSNPAFEWTTAKLKELAALNEAKTKQEQELAALRDSSNRWLYDHEEAYLLSPEYREQAAQVNLYNTEFGHWSRQLANAQKGNPVYNVTTDANGKLVVDSTPIEPSPEIIAQIHANMIAANGARQEMQSKLQSWQSGHKQKFQTFRQRISGLEQTLFPNGVTEEIKPQIEQAMQQFPAELRNDPMTRALGIASVLFKGYSARIKELESQVAGKSALKAAEARQGSADPKPSSRAAGQTALTVEQELERLQAAVV